MNRIVNRRMRAAKKRRYNGPKIKVNFMAIVVIICLSVGAGYLTAKYIVYPILGYSPVNLDLFGSKQGESDANKEADSKQDPAQKQQTEKTETEVKTDKEDKITSDADSSAQQKTSEKKIPDQGYHLQYGSFKKKSAAEERLAELDASGIDAKIVKKDHMYKIIGQLFETKKAAKKALKKTDSSIDAFVTEI